MREIILKARCKKCKRRVYHCGLCSNPYNEVYHHNTQDTHEVVAEPIPKKNSQRRH
jgi:hypothetical protein